VAEHRHPNDASLHGALAGLQATKQAPIEQHSFLKKKKSKQQSEQYSTQ